jgi:hypothetical protein
VAGLEEPLEAPASVQSKAAVLSAPSFARGALQALGIPRGEDHVDADLYACAGSAPSM